MLLRALGLGAEGYNGSVCGPSGSAASRVEIPLPGGGRAAFDVHSVEGGSSGPGPYARASVIKDAGDDPDVTNGAEIAAEVRLREMVDMDHGTNGCGLKSDGPQDVIIRGGSGVGVVTKPGLPVPRGEPAINPVPRQMIRQAVAEAVIEEKADLPPGRSLEVTISVPRGEIISRKTLNSRLGIVGGISILGTTGIVRPLSSEAWTATITSSMDVALAMGNREIVLSAGRASEKAHMGRYGLPEESYVMMGDYLEFSLLDARSHGFERIHLCSQWAKMLKIALATPQTHVRHGAIDLGRAVGLLNRLGIEVPRDRAFNTAREVFDFLRASESSSGTSPFSAVCRTAQDYAEAVTKGVPVRVHLVSYEGEIIASSE